CRGLTWPFHSRRPRHVAASGGPRFRALVWCAANRERGSPSGDRQRSGEALMIVLGLTGSIGMGKSTTATMFREAGVPVHDAAETVHRLYSGAAAHLIEARFPGVVTDGTVDREKLAKIVLGNTEAIRALEKIVHPLVRQASQEFLES